MESRRRLAAESLVLARQTVERALQAEVMTQVALGLLDWDAPQSAQLFKEANAIWRALGYKRSLARGLMLGAVAEDWTDLETVRAALQEARAIFSELGDTVSEDSCAQLMKATTEQ